MENKDINVMNVEEITQEPKMISRKYNTRSNKILYEKLGFRQKTYR